MHYIYLQFDSFTHKNIVSQFAILPMKKGWCEALRGLETLALLVWLEWRQHDARVLL